MRLYMKMLSPKLVLLFVIVTGAVGVTVAQDNPPPDGSKPQVDGRKNEKPNFLRQLGLTPEQFQQIRRMNQARKPEMDRAAVRLRMANRALDETIYADTVDDAGFQARLRELQAAQADMARLRFTGELGVRKVLTPEQLARFRELRQRFAPPPPDQRGPVGVDDRNPTPQRDLRRVP
jgi:Spy/CpxP family protein refolding chaperone